MVLIAKRGREDGHAYWNYTLLIDLVKFKGSNGTKFGWQLYWDSEGSGGIQRVLKLQLGCS